MSDYSQRLKKALFRESQKVFDYNNKTIKKDFFLEINCPVCSSDKRTIKYVKDFFKFYECSSCGMIYLNPRLTDKATYDFYNGDWTKVYNEKKFDISSLDIKNMDNRRDIDNLLLIKKYKPHGGILLEIGIGKGYFLKNAIEMNFNVYGIELNKENCEKANTLLNNQGIIINNNLFDASLQSNFFDIVYMKDVFEHVPNPDKMLAEINRICKKGALIFIEVPNIEGAIFQVVKEKHVTIFGFEHLNYWSSKTLKLALSKNGFQMVEKKYQSDDFTIPYIISYLYIDTNTSLATVNQNKFVLFILRVVCYVFRIRPLSFIGNLTNKIVDFLGKGSQIKVLAIKNEDIE